MHVNLPPKCFVLVCQCQTRELFTDYSSFVVKNWLFLFGSINPLFTIFLNVNALAREKNSEFIFFVQRFNVNFIGTGLVARHNLDSTAGWQTSAEDCF